MAKKILLIDDDRNILELAQLGLSRQGYQVFTACDGQAGCELAVQEKPHLVILDINMSRLDGWDTLKRLKGSRATDQIPVLMLTTEGLVKDVDRAMEMGAAGYLVKPLDLNRMIKKVASLLDGQ